MQTGLSFDEVRARFSRDWSFELWRFRLRSLSDEIEVMNP
jgi:hypothetical protein